MIGLRTRVAAVAELHAQIVLSRSMERGLAAVMRRILKDSAREAKHRYLDMGGLDSALQSVRTFKSPIEYALKRQYARAVTLATARFEKVLRRKAAEGVLSFKADEDGMSEAELVRSISKYARDHAAKRAEDISETTRTRIQRAVSKGLKDGLDASAIADLIEEKTGGNISDYRAEVIARTETHAAMQYGSLEAATATGVADTKTWLAAIDARTRDDHREVDGQTVPIDAEFTGPVGGMLFPGDPHGPPEEVINCRCILLYNSTGVAE